MYTNISQEFTTIDDLPDFIQDFFVYPKEEKELEPLDLTRLSSASTACSSVDLDDSLLFKKPRTCKMVTGLVRILKQFTRCGKTCPVKTQNFLSQLSRSFARMFTDCKGLLQGTKQITEIMSSRGLYKFSIANIEKVKIAQSLFAEYFSKSSEINKIFGSNNQLQKNGQNSTRHGLEYLEWALSQNVLRPFWTLFLDLVFEGTPLPDLCDKFGMQCCDTLEHKECCLDKWAQLRDYLHRDLMIDLQVKDLFTNEPNRLL